ncbi:MAG: MogA/MoaB family molybdenum cofactor biosynthesis protein [Candidatus Bathyarchaeia archaeon]
MSHTSLEHKHEAPRSLTFAVVTISTSKYERSRRGFEVDDLSGDLIVKFLEGAGHRISSRFLIPDDPEKIAATIEKIIENEQINAIVTTGGTGIARSDVTIEVVRRLLEKELQGFGEALRRISYERIGSAAILTRAIAGVKRGKAIFCLPGSPNAVETALHNLIIPEAPHIVKHAMEA